MRDWTLLDTARRFAENRWNEFPAEHRGQLDVIVTTYRLTFLDQFGVDLRDSDLLFDHWVATVNFVLAAEDLGVQSCGDPDLVCYAAFEGHLDHAFGRVSIILRELAKTAGAPPFNPEDPTDAPD